MRAVLAALIVCLFAFLTVPADAHARHLHSGSRPLADRINQAAYGGPAAMPVYQYESGHESAALRRDRTRSPVLRSFSEGGTIHQVAKQQPRERVPVERAVRGGIVTVPTAAGISITVAASLASRFEALVADFVAAGYHPRHIGCFAHGGHVRNSRHYAGAACDFDQRGWGRTVAFMYTQQAHQIIVAHGFRDGRDFRDQGHVDDGVSIGIRYARHRYASRYGG